MAGLVSLTLSIVSLSQFYPTAKVVVNVTPGTDVEIVQQLHDGSFVPADTFIKRFKGTARPRIMHVSYTKDTKAICTQTINGSLEPSTASLRLRSCALLP